MKRIDWLDRLKGLLIVLVVLGHAVGTVSHFVTGWGVDVCRFAFKFIYFFHMPAFFFLAGVLARDVAWGDVLKKKARRLLVPYWVFGLASVGVFLLAIGGFGNLDMTDAYYARDFASIPWWHMMGSLAYGAPLPGTDGFRCNGALWFLPCLFTCSLILLGLIKLGRKVLLGVVAVVCVPVFVFLQRLNCPTLPFGLSRIPEFLPIAILGYALSGRLKLESRTWLVLPFLYFAACFFVSYDWQMYTSYGTWTATVAMGVLGTLACCVVAKAMRGAFLVMLGRMTIGIMLIHKWVLLVLVKLGLHEAVVLTILCVGVSYCLTLLVRKYAPWALGEPKVQVGP